MIFKTCILKLVWGKKADLLSGDHYIRLLIILHSQNKDVFFYGYGK